jgi:hypothetical protein
LTTYLFDSSGHKQTERVVNMHASLDVHAARLHMNLAESNPDATHNAVVFRAAGSFLSQIAKSQGLLLANLCKLAGMILQLQLSLKCKTLVSSSAKQRFRGKIRVARKGAVAGKNTPICNDQRVTNASCVAALYRCA